jgi:putative transposase
VIKELRWEYPVRVLCRVLEVSTSGYHAWLRRVPSQRARSRERLKLAVQAAHARTRQTYGARRLQRELAADGFVASLGTIRRVRRELGLCCVQRKRRFRVATTDSRHSLAVAPNLLAQDFTAAHPGEVWTADITYVPTEEGWLYLAALKDLFAGEIVGRSFGARMTTELVVRAFEQAVSACRPVPGLIHQTESRLSVLQSRVSGVVSELRDESLDEPEGELLRQRAHRELLGDVEDRVGASPTVSNSRRGRA